MAVRGRKISLNFSLCNQMMIMDEIGTRMAAPTQHFVVNGAASQTKPAHRNRFLKFWTKGLIRSKFLNEVCERKVKISNKQMKLPTVGCKRAVRNQDVGFHFTFRPQVFFRPQILALSPLKESQQRRNQDHSKALALKIEIDMPYALVEPREVYPRGK